MSSKKEIETLYLTIMLTPKKGTYLVLSDEDQNILETVSVKNGKIEVRESAF